MNQKRLQSRAGLCLVFTVLLLFQCVSFAQTKYGSIAGVVTDSTTQEVLFGTSVQIENTSLGAATDLEGQYKIIRIKPGTYNVIFRYVGYEQRIIPVVINEDQVLKLDVKLTSQTIEGQEIVVTAQAKGQKEAINQQLSSPTIVNIVSSDKIRQLPDANASTALSRLPGISLMNGDQVVVRGIQAKQNLVLVNGIQLPSTDMNSRATNLGFISSNMLSGIEVVKVLTPDMDANAIGGVINLRLREAPSGLHFDMMSQGSYNQQDITWGNYKFWASISNRFFDDKLGVFVQANADRSDGGNEQANAVYEIAQDLPYGHAPYKMRTFTFADQQNITTTYGGSIILDYKLPKGKLVLQNTISSSVDDNATHNTQYSLFDNRFIISLNRDKFKRTLLINALQTEYNFGDIKAEFTISHSFSDRKTDIRFGDPLDAVNFQNTSVTTPYIDAAGNPITYETRRNTLTEEQARNIRVDPENYKGAKIQDWGVLRENGYKQHIYNSSLDLTLPVSFSSDFSSKFKMGGKFIRTTRKNDLDEWYKRTGDAEFYAGSKNFFPGRTLTTNNPLLFTDLMEKDYKRGKHFLNDAYNYIYAFNIEKTSDFFARTRDGWGPSAVHKLGSETNDYYGSEMFTAAYLMGTFNIGSKIEVIAGGRFEQYNMKYKASNFYVMHSVDGVGKSFDTLNTTNRTDNNFFPNAQIRYKFADWCDIRLAYSKTISRPDYTNILPNILFNPGNTGNNVGNPKLKPATSDNFDAYLSFYNNEIGLFTVGGFYKKIINTFNPVAVFYRNLGYVNAFFPDSSFWQKQGVDAPKPSENINVTVNNPYPAHIKGLEFDWQTNFWYLPQPFNSLVLNINYTKVWSDMDYQQIRNTTVKETYVDPVSHKTKTRFNYVTTDTVRNARLVNQGNDVINIALGIDYKGFSGRISFNMMGNVITNVGNRPEADNYTRNIYKWDFTLKQELPVEGLSVSLNGINIFHNPVQTFQKFRREVGGEISENLATTTYSARLFEFNVRYTF